jgi:hypothetical protein
MSKSATTWELRERRERINKKNEMLRKLAAIATEVRDRIIARGYLTTALARE